MKYIASLEGKNGKIYTANIITQGDNSEVKELTFAANGLVVRIDNNDDLFAPILAGSASLTFLTDELLNEIYSVGATDVPISIYEDAELIFAGYVLPNLYSQELPAGKKELTIECRDALSALQDVKYSGESANMTIMDYITMALDSVKGVFPLSLQVVEPYDVPLADMVVQSANWYDESGEPETMGELLSSIMKWLNVRIVQWRDKWMITDVRSLKDTLDIDNYSANGSISLSLTETYNKAKVNVSLYSGGNVVEQLFDGANYVGTETWRRNGLKGDPSDYSSILGFYSHPQVTQNMYADGEADTPLKIENTGDAMAKNIGAWLVRQYSQRVIGKVTEEDDSQEPKNYLVLTNPVFEAPWRTWYNATGKSYVLAVIEDTQERIYTSNDIIVISGSALLSRIPAPLLCPSFGGGKYFPSDGDYEEGREMTYPPAIILRISVDDREYGMVSGGVFGWNEDKTDATYTNRYPIYLWNENHKKDVWNISHQIPDTIYKYFGSDLSGAGISMADGLTGKLRVEILTYSAEEIDSMWISDLSINVKKSLGGTPLEWFNSSVDADNDVEYSADVSAGSVKEAPEVTLKLSTNVGADYSRSVVFNKNGMAPIGELTSTYNNEKGIAENHLLSAMVAQYEKPRMKLSGTWRKFIGTPTAIYHSEALGKTMICNGIECNLHASESTLNLEEIII